jgi:alpha-1,6-mannosyltransferase
LNDNPLAGLLFGVLGSVSAAGYVAAVLVVRSDNSPQDFLSFFAIFFGLACAWGLALWLAARVEPGRRWILAGAVVFRLLLLPAGMSLDTRQYQRQLLYDDDVWRYLWEGHAWSAGVDPMRTPPGDLEEYALEQRDPVLYRRLFSDKVWSGVWDNIGYRPVASPYPYTAQAVFRLASWIAPGSVLAFKLIILAFDLGAVWLLASLAGRGASGAVVLLAYAWNPLVIKEFAGSAHIDAVLVCLLLAAVRLLGTRGSLLLGAAALVKPVVLLFAPAFWRRAGWKGLLGPVLALLLLGYSRPDGLRAYAEGWTFNPALFRLLPGNRTIGMAIAAAVVLAVLAWWVRYDDGSRHALFRQALWLIGAFLLMTPMFAPWYLTWLLPFAALQMSWFWLALSGSVFLSYHAYLNFSELPALAVLEFAMPLLAWIWLRRASSGDAVEDRHAILGLSSLAGLAGGLCCVTPVLLVMSGVAGVSTAAAFGNILYGDYRWAFRLASLGLLAGALVHYFRQRGVCTLDEAKRRRHWLLNVSLLALAASGTVYIFWTYVVVHYWGIAAGLPWRQYDESWALPVAVVLAATTAALFVVLRRARSES